MTFTLSGGSPATADGGALLFDVVTFNPSQAAEETSAFPDVDWSEIANAWLAKIIRAINFLGTQLTPESDWHYAGKGVTIDTPDRPIYWHRPDPSAMYTVSLLPEECSLRLFRLGDELLVSGLLELGPVFGEHVRLDHRRIVLQKAQAATEPHAVGDQVFGSIGVRRE